MATTTAKNPISDVMYNWLTVLHSKAEGVQAYETYIADAEAASATECAALLKRLHDEDVKLLEEVKQHVYGMIADEREAE